MDYARVGFKVRETEANTHRALSALDLNKNCQQRYAELILVCPASVVFMNPPNHLRPLIDDRGDSEKAPPSRKVRRSPLQRLRSRAAVALSREAGMQVSTMVRAVLPKIEMGLAGLGYRGPWSHSRRTVCLLLSFGRCEPPHTGDTMTRIESTAFALHVPAYLSWNLSWKFKATTRAAAGQAQVVRSVLDRLVALPVAVQLL
ncbi:hypothetical protein EDB92DRAFT_1115750 [Lactarius akahatsu]|uniref:Uncharacterized protein n=1 Tax=Lactarius akahatsu TaxID=416441 RepID=A0AAD4QBQ8_9AGAM|nr:hypothetical protein EDB92DRAFT_1115750 [Lactarius akahatsu]